MKAGILEAQGYKAVSAANIDDRPGRRKPFDE
jgi:hypothetical protein